MKKLIASLLWIIIFLFLVTSADAQAPKPTIWGVVMGISKYMNVPSLKYADRDALSFYEYLLSPAGGKADTNNIRLLLNEKATSYNFFEAMDNLVDAVKEGDMVYIYFAGHGDIEKKTERQNGFLIGYNAPANCYAAGGSIGVRYLQDYVETLVSKNKSKVILIVDACRSGKLAGGREGAEITALALKAEWKGVTKILSCQPGETSLEGENWGGGAGVFTYFMLKGLKGQADADKNSSVSLLELSHFLEEEIPKETDNKQLPDVVGDKRQDIAKVDKETYLELLNKPERKTILPENLSSGFEPNLNSINDVSIIKAYERFKDYIKNDNLIAYNDIDAKKETALSIYRSIEGHRDANSLIPVMKGELLAALQNRAQTKINEWITGNQKKSDSIDAYKTFINLKTAYEIVDSSYIHYNQIKYRYIFWTQYYEKDTTKKIKILEECIKIDPSTPFAYLNIGKYYLDLKKFDKALENFDKAIEYSKNWTWPWDNKGSAYSNLGKYSEAMKCYDKAIEIDPGHAAAWYGKGNIFSRIGKYEEALKYYDKTIELDPDKSMSWNNKGITLMRLGKYKDAINFINKAIELDTNNNAALINKGNLINIFGKPGEAIKYYDKALALNPDHTETWWFKGNSLRDIGKNEEAVKCYDKAIETRPNFSDAWVSKGYLYLNLGKYDEALRLLEKPIEIDPKDPLAWYNKGNALSNIGKNEEAIKYLDKAIELKPDYYPSSYVKGTCLVELKNYEEAIKYFDKVLDLEPKHAYSLYSKGVSYYFLKNNNEMLKYFKKAFEIDPSLKDFAKKDKDLKGYWEDPEFKKLVE